MLTFKVAIRGNDGAIFFVDETTDKQIKKLASPGRFLGSKWKYIIREMHKHRRACKVRLVVGYNGVRDYEYEELVYRPIKHEKAKLK